MVSNYQIALARSCNLSTPVCPILFKSFNACIKVSCFNLAWQMCTGWQRDDLRKNLWRWWNSAMNVLFSVSIIKAASSTFTDDRSTPSFQLIIITRKPTNNPMSFNLTMEPSRAFKWSLVSLAQSLVWVVHGFPFTPVSYDVVICCMPMEQWCHVYVIMSNVILHLTMSLS